MNVCTDVIFKCAVIVITEGSTERTSLSAVVAVILSARGDRHIAGSGNAIFLFHVSSNLFSFKDLLVVQLFRFCSILWLGADNPHF